MNASSDKSSDELDLDADPTVRVLAPWERVFGRFVTPFEHFVQQQTASGVLLLIAAAVALLLANSELAPRYYGALQTTLTVAIGRFALDMSFHHWVNDGLMALFFFVVGLEIKRELLVGDLSQPRQALLPLFAAVGGMLAPALIYIALVAGGDATRGWGIPMATDIAFALGALALLGKRIPRSALTFLMALAIVDDLGALTVIALYYSDDVNARLLGATVLILVALIACNRFGLRRPWPYFLGGCIMWLLLLKSGVHATLAGVTTAVTVPVLPKYHPERFIEAFDKLVERYRAAVTIDPSPLRNQTLRSTLQTMENAAIGVRSPLERSLHRWDGWVAFGVMPLFALANAGMTINIDSVHVALQSSIATGVFVGMLLGKPLGICIGAWICVRTGLCQLPTNLTWQHIFGLSLLAGVGFTMSLFIGELAFAGSPANTAATKLAVVAASTVAGLLGMAWLHRSIRTTHF